MSARRYVYRGFSPELREQVALLAPGAVITETEGVLEVIVSEKELAAYDANQPASASETEEVHDLTPKLMVPVRADLLEALMFARGSAALDIAVNALTTDNRKE